MHVEMLWANLNSRTFYTFFNSQSVCEDNITSNTLIIIKLIWMSVNGIFRVLGSPILFSSIRKIESHLEVSTTIAQYLDLELSPTDWLMASQLMLVINFAILAHIEPWLVSSPLGSLRLPSLFGYGRLFIINRCQISSTGSDMPWAAERLLWTALELLMCLSTESLSLSFRSSYCDTMPWSDVINGIWTSPYLSFRQRPNVLTLFWSCGRLLFLDITLFSQVTRCYDNWNVKSTIIWILPTSRYDHSCHPMRPQNWTIIYYCLRHYTSSISETQ